MIYLDFNDGLHILYREVDELSLLNKLFVTLISEKLNINNYITNTTIQNKLYLKDTLNNIDYIIDDSISNIKNLINTKCINKNNYCTLIYIMHNSCYIVL